MKKIILHLLLLSALLLIPVTSASADALIPITLNADNVYQKPEASATASIGQNTGSPTAQIAADKGNTINFTALLKNPTNDPLTNVYAKIVFDTSGATLVTDPNLNTSDGDQIGTIPPQGTHEVDFSMSIQNVPVSIAFFAGQTGSTNQNQVTMNVIAPTTSNPDNKTSGSGTGSGTGSGGSTPQCSLDSPGTTLCNPLPDADVNGLVLRLVKYVLSIIAGIAAIMIVLSGFRMVASGGNEETVKGARDTITWSVVGLVLALLAYSIVAIIENLLTK